jgi:steroid 5-alpha reductase family enzyme
LWLQQLLTRAQFTADNQQNSYQNFKHSGGVPDPNAWPGARLAWTAADAKRGFVSHGLWAWSRHPNFLCEQVGLSSDCS